jgi:UDP-N-acetylglucosamine--N-acetylmuramyl-(pentapeptide) pyrophosphoryl-undecaprenol N-acetylglucosamine transferase
VKHTSGALLAAGGTGGHVFPAVAVAEALGARGYDRESLRFVTESRRLSTQAIEGAGFAYDLLPLHHGLQRRLTLRNLRVLAEAVASLVVAFRLVRRHRPAVVVGFGAYVSLPVVIAAWLLRVPVVVHEQNGHPGLANRVAVRLGARAAVSLDGTPLRGAVVTGNPVRPAIAGVERAPSTPPLVAVAGGSLGSAVLNDAVLGIALAHRDDDRFHLRHVTGERFADAVGAAAAAAGVHPPRYEVVAFEHDMAGLYTRCAVFVGRSGGMVAELCAAGVPSVLVPWTGAAGDHQTANARILAEAGAAVVVPERECTAERLDAEISGLVADPQRLAAMSAAARRLGRPDAADRVAALVEQEARR